MFYFVAPFTLEIFISKFLFNILLDFQNKNFLCEMGLRQKGQPKGKLSASANVECSRNSN